MNKLKDLYKRFKVPLWTILGIAGVFLVWYLLALIIKSSLFPKPGIVIALFFRLLGEKETYLSIGGTILRLIASVGAGFICGLVLGVIAGLSEGFRAFIRPVIIIFRTIPTAAVIYLLIVLISPRYAPLVIVFLMTFPILYESILSGMTSVSRSIIDAASIDGASTFKKIFKIYLPLSWNYIILGLVSSIGLGMKVAIMSEIFAGSGSAPGLGKLIRDASLTVDMKAILAYSLMAIIIIGMVDIGVYFIKRRIKRQTGIKEKK